MRVKLGKKPAKPTSIDRAVAATGQTQLLLFHRPLAGDSGSYKTKTMAPGCSFDLNAAIIYLFVMEKMKSMPSGM